GPARRAPGPPAPGRSPQEARRRARRGSRRGSRARRSPRPRRRPAPRRGRSRRARRPPDSPAPSRGSSGARECSPARWGSPGMTSSIRVDVWSDIACPWCFIGKRKFEAGLAAFDGADDVTVTYHSFELSPDTPVDFEDSEVDFLSAHKGMPKEQVEQMLRQVTTIARDVGLRYDFDAVRHTKTLLAHEALHFAKEHGKQLELVERLFAAY